MARFEEKNGKIKVIIELGRDERTGVRNRHTKSGFKTKREAKAYAALMESELLKGNSFNNSKVLLKDFIIEWYDRQIVGTLSINTVTNYGSRINQHIIPYLGQMQLSKIKPLNVQDFYYYLLDNGLNNDSAKRIIKVLKKCLTYAYKLNLINNVPCDIEFKSTIKTIPKLNIFSEDQLIYFLNQMEDTYLYLPVILAAFTGIRIGELCGLRWCNVDLDNNRIKICEQVLNDKINKTLIHTKILKTSKSFRTITIPKFLKDILIGIKPNTKLIEYTNDFVVLSRNETMCNPRNLSMDFVKKVDRYTKEYSDVSEKFLKEVGMYMQLPKLSFHDLRHTHATLLLLHGENVKVISERLGHSSIKMTLDTYSHVLPSMEEHTALLLDTLYSTKIKR